MSGTSSKTCESVDLFLCSTAGSVMATLNTGHGCPTEQLPERMLMSSPPYVLTVRASIVSAGMCALSMRSSVHSGQDSLCLRLSVVVVMLWDCKHQIY